MIRRLAAAAVLVLGGFAGTGVSPASAATPQHICDVYASYGTPCVAANSTTHALFAAYSGPLYTVQRDSDGQQLVISTLVAGGVANAAAQDSFCRGTVCRIVDIADQTPYNNDLAPAPKGGNGGPDGPAIANELPVYVGGQKAYGVMVTPGVGYADDLTYKIPTGQQPEGELMVTSGLEHNYGCCFDYGQSETSRNDDGDGRMEAVNYGGAGYIGADMENGIWGLPNPFKTDFITAMVSSNQTSNYRVSGGNAQTGGLTSTTLPLTGPYKPMHLEGGMVLGVGGDISSTAEGDFFEGVMVAGQPSTAADNAVQAAIVAEGYSY